MPEEKKVPDVKFITSLALAVVGVDEKVSHIQLSIVQDVDTKEFRAFMDVVDPTKVHLKEDA